MSDAVCQDAVTVETRTQSVPFLISCLHASALLASREEIRRAFDTIERLLSNRVQNPAEPRYASFSATSTVWVNSVLPFVNVFYLVSWMGCQWSAEGTRLVFMDRRLHVRHPGAGDAEETQKDATVQEQLADRLDELRCVASVWNSSALETSMEYSKHCGVARQRLAMLFQSTPDIAGGGEWLARHITHLQLHRLLAHARGVEPQQVTTPISDRSWKLEGRGGFVTWALRAQRALDITESLSSPRPWSDAQRTRHGECETLQRCLAHDSMQWMLSHASLCGLRRMCEEAASDAVSSSSGYREQEGCPVPLTPGLSSTVAERLRQRSQREQHERYLETTGPAYRQLSQEERHRAESVIVSIAALLEQIAVVSETQGMVRHDRHEAHRLINRFRQDGDLAALYRLEEEYTAQLEEAKLLYGKPLVYAASFKQ